MLRELMCYLFGHRGALSERPYLVVEDGRPRKETMVCWRCTRCDRPLLDMGLAGTQGRYPSTGPSGVKE
jgi:hypothetical protein